jgi:hypothetical protein
LSPTLMLMFFPPSDFQRQIPSAGLADKQYLDADIRV